MEEEFEMIKCFWIIVWVTLRVLTINISNNKLLLVGFVTHVGGFSVQ